MAVTRPLLAIRVPEFILHLFLSYLGSLAVTRVTRVVDPALVSDLLTPDCSRPQLAYFILDIEEGKITDSPLCTRNYLRPAQYSLPVM